MSILPVTLNLTFDLILKIIAQNGNQVHCPVTYLSPWANFFSCISSPHCFEGGGCCDVEVSRGPPRQAEQGIESMIKEKLLSVHKNPFIQRHYLIWLCVISRDVMCEATSHHGG